jgi:hypothetical protein
MTTGPAGPESLVNWEELESLLSEWVSQHYAPSRCDIVIDGHMYSPQDILDAVHWRRPVGVMLASTLYAASRAYDVPVARFIRSTIEANARARR